jgi:tetratricopeptide (TPR) repeat protein
MMIRLPKMFAVCLCCFWVVSAQSQSYISRLWNTKKYEAITEYSAKGATLSGQDNAFVGRAFMALDPPQPMRALSHYDLAIAKRWQREDLYFFRSEANYAIKKYDAALADLEVCLQMRPNYQKYLLSKAGIAYEKGDKELAYKTYYTLSELYDKQTPYFMLVVINIERERYIKAQEQIEDNLLRFERGKEFWTFTSEQEVELEWRVFKDYPKALKAQEALLSFKPNHAPYLINRLLLLRVTQNDTLAAIAEEDFQERYNTNAIPLEYYKKGSFKVNERFSTNGVIEDFRYFRPRLFESKKYSRFYVSDNGRVVGEHWASLQISPIDSTQKLWQFYNGVATRYTLASDTSYVGFSNLFELPDSAFTMRPSGEIRMGMDTLEQYLPYDSLPQVPLPKDTVPATGEIPLFPVRQDSTGVREAL